MQNKNANTNSIIDGANGANGAASRRKAEPQPQSRPDEQTQPQAAPREAIGLRIFRALSKVNTQLFALIVLMLLAFQIIIGIFIPVSSQMELAALYFGKTVVIRLLGYLGIAIGAIEFYCRAYVYRKTVLKWTFLKRPWTGLLAMLLVWSLFAVGIARDRELAFFGGPYRYEGFLSYLAYAGIFVCAMLIKSEKYRKILYVAIAASATTLAGLTLIKELTGAPFLMKRSGLVGPYSGTFINLNHYGYYLCVSLIVIAGLFMMSKKWQGKLAAGLCFELNVIVLLYNTSLGPYIAIALGLVLLFVFNWIRKGIKKTLPLLILIACFAGSSFIINGHRVLNDLQLFTQQTGNVISVIGSGGATTEEQQQTIDSYGSARGVIWKNTIKTMLDHPAMGVGTDNVQLFINNEIPHNEYLQVGANLGFPGLFLYLAALISCFAYTVKNLKKLSDGALLAGMATLVYCASAFVGISIPVTTFQLFFFLGLLCAWFRARDDERMNEEALGGPAVR